MVLLIFIFELHFPLLAVAHLLYLLYSVAVPMVSSCCIVMLVSKSIDLVIIEQVPRLISPTKTQRKLSNETLQDKKIEDVIKVLVTSGTVY